MFENLVRIFWIVVGGYLVVGLLFAAVFHVRGIVRIDPGVKGAGWFFRLLITPGLVGLWPLMAARWRGALGERERPVTARGIRSFHRRLTYTMLLVLPLLAGASIALRPSRPESIPPAPIVGERDSAFGDLPVTVRLRQDGERRQLELAVAADLQIPTLMLYWSPEGSSGFPGSARLLGAVWGPGTRRYPVPESGGTLTLYSMAHAETIATFELAELGRSE